MRRTSLKLTPGMILRRGHYGYFFYYWLYSLIWDYRLAGKLLDKTVFNDEPGAYPVQSISYLYLKELLKVVKLQKEDVFVDVGCAWGRLIGYLHSHLHAKKFIGVELNSEVAKIAVDIFKHEESVEIIEGDVLIKLPLEGTVFFLFNPFDAKVLEQFLIEVEQKISHSVTLLYLHPTCRHLVDARHLYWHLKEEINIKPKHLGSLTLCVYERTYAYG